MNIKQEQKSSAEKRQTVLTTAMLLREKREDSRVRQENAKQRLSLLQRQYLINLEKKQLVRNLLNESRMERYNRLRNDLNDEKIHWINKDFIASKITVELFSKPCSTGSSKANSFMFSNTYPMNKYRSSHRV